MGDNSPLLANISDPEALVHMKTSMTMGRQLMWDNPAVFDGKMESADQEGCEAIYHRWIQDCKDCIASDRLLVFNVKEGWQPLCQFLGVPVPDEPFPKLWDADKFKQAMDKRAAGHAVSAADK